ncbi:MAG: hypothetical protein O2973_08135 [Gemmatimonadetes bacterium]|nr:hypothetical protein [Gemmatimonadota bacterium]
MSDRTRLRLIGADGTVSTVPTPGVELDMAVGLARDGADVLVADYGARRVIRVGPGGAAVVPGSDGLWANGVASGPNGVVYVLDNPPLATCVWTVAVGEKSKRACVRPQQSAVLFGLFSLVGILALAIALRPPQRAFTWVLGVIIVGLMTALSLSVAANSRLEGLRPLMAGLFAAAVVIPLWERFVAARARRTVTASK